MEQEPKKSPQEFADSWQDDIGRISSPEYVYEEFQRAIKEHGLDLTKNLKVLEVGSGNAVFLDFLKKKGVNVIGVDIQIRGEGGKESPLAIARIEQLPFADESFDVVLSNQVFDSSVYDHNQNIMIKEIVRVLKHDGFYLGRESHNMKVSSIEGFKLISDNSTKKWGLNTIYKKS